ncbi:MAG: response regulator transcription factor [Gemmatimonadaceae bacterium]
MLRDVRSSVAFTGGIAADVAAPAAGAALRLLSNAPAPSYESRGDARAPLALRVVSSNRLMREGLAELLSQRTGFLVESSAPDVLTGLDRAMHAGREIIVLDHATDRDRVMQLVTDARRAMPHADVIVTGVVSRESVAELVDAGVRAFVMQGASPEELVATIGTLAADAPLPEVPSMIVVQTPRDDSRPHRSRGPREVQLTPREQQVIQLIVDGMCNKEIAAALGVAIHTVKSHVHSVLQKLSVGSRLALAALVRRQSGIRETMSLPMNTPEPRGHTFRLAR